MPKKLKDERQQIGVRLTPEAVEALELLRLHYAHEAGLNLPFSQSETVDKLLRETARREGLKIKGKT
jgi:hypothetical protein